MGASVIRFKIIEAAARCIPKSKYFFEAWLLCLLFHFMQLALLHGKRNHWRALKNRQLRRNLAGLLYDLYPTGPGADYTDAFTGHIKPLLWPAGRVDRSASKVAEPLQVWCVRFGGKAHTSEHKLRLNGFSICAGDAPLAILFIERCSGDAFLEFGVASKVELLVDMREIAL